MIEAFIILGLCYVFFPTRRKTKSQQIETRPMQKLRKPFVKIPLIESQKN